ncbi:HEPN domain-containing protein [Candidatus Woesearchaeota archaeon]|nr:HEPN domain-containing protein [Candidatus Woesearchaeota archaeon]
MILPFENYINQGKVKKKTPDPEEAKSLFERAKQRLNYTNVKKITDKTAHFVLEDAYEVIRESAQSLMSIKGFKPYSHEATVSFVKEYFYTNFTEEDIQKFDRYRQLRNNSVYRAEPVTQNDAKECLAFSKLFFKKIKKIINSSQTIKSKDLSKT